MAAFRKIIDEITGNDDLAQAEKEALRSLEAQAKQKADYFEQQVKLSLYSAGDGKIDKTVPVSVVTKKSRQSRCYSANDSGKIAEEIKNAINNFIGGSTNDVVEGVFGLLGAALTAFLGESSSSSDEFYDYFIYSSPFGIYRVDCYAWFQMVTASTIKTKVERATAFSYTHSIVDISQIKWQDFVGIYGLQLQNENLSEDQVEEARDNIDKTWKYLLSEPSDPAVSGALSRREGMGGPAGARALPSAAVAQGSGRGPLSRSRELVEAARLEARGAPAAARLPGDSKAWASRGRRVGKPIRGNHPKQVVADVTKFPYAPVGRLEMEFRGGSAIGTGTLIAAKNNGNHGRLVLTCAHNLWEAKWGGEPIRVRFSAAMNNGKSIETVAAKAWRFPAEFAKSDVVRNDYALVLLEKEIGVPRYAELAETHDIFPDTKGELLGMYGFDDQDGDMFLGEGVITLMSEYAFNYAISTKYGTSGTRLTVGGDSRLRGIHVEAGPEGQEYNIARRITRDLLDNLQAWEDEWAPAR